MYIQKYVLNPIISENYKIITGTLLKERSTSKFGHKKDFAKEISQIPMCFLYASVAKAKKG